MFYKVKAVNALENYRLSVQFAEGITKIYNVSQLFEKGEVFRCLIDNPSLFSNVQVDVHCLVSFYSILGIHLSEYRYCSSDSQYHITRLHFWPNVASSINTWHPIVALWQPP